MEPYEKIVRAVNSIPQNKATMKTPLLLSTSAIILQRLSSVQGFSPTSYQTISVLSTTQQKMHIEHHRIQQSAGSAFASPSRLFFTPKEDNNSSGDKPFIRPALHNSPFFRSLAILYALLFAIYQGSNAPSDATANALQKVGKYFILSPKAAATVHLLSFATWFGTVVYTTFVAGITVS